MPIQPSYSFNVRCSDCNFKLAVNDMIVYHLDRGANFNAELPIDTYLLFMGNEFSCTITPPKGSAIIPEGAKLSLTVNKCYIESTTPNEQIFYSQTGSYKIEDGNPPKSIDLLYGKLDLMVRDKTLLEAGIELNQIPNLKEILFDKYQHIFFLLKNRNVDEVIALFKLRNNEVASLTGQSEEEVNDDILKDFNSYVSDSSLELWEFTIDKVFLKIYGYNKLACLEVANGNQPICFINRKDRIAIYIPIYFFLNPSTKQFEIIR